MLQEICQIPHNGHPLNNSHVFRIKFDRTVYPEDKEFFFFLRQYTVKKVLAFIEETYCR